MFGIVAPRSLRAFEADSRQPDKEPVVFCCPRCGFRRRGKFILGFLSTCRLDFRLEDAGKAGSRFVEDPDKLGCRRQQQTKEFSLQDILGGKIGKRLDLFDAEDGVVENSSLEGWTLEFRNEGLEDFGRRANVAFAYASCEQPDGWCRPGDA